MELLEKIALNTEPKDSFQIVVTDNKTRFTTRFNPHIQLKKNKSYEIALVNLETYYSFPNVTSENNHLFARCRRNLVSRFCAGRKLRYRRHQ